jgi:ATP-binding cassette subfamily B protein
MRDFKQHDATDCGAACLSYIFHLHGLRVTIAALRQRAGTNRSGTTALGLVETAKGFGFEAKGIRCRFDDLRSLPTPGVAHVVLEGGRQHYVVVCRFQRRRVCVMDPAVGRRQWWSIDRFKSSWSNVYVVLAPASDFVGSDKQISAWQRLVTLLAPQKQVLAQAFTGIVLTTLLSLAGAIYIQKIVDTVIVDGNRNLLRLLSLGMLVVLGLRVMVGYFQSRLMLRSAQRIDAGLLLGYYRHLMRLPQSFFDTMRVGEITSRMRDVVAVRDFLNNTILSLFVNPLILAVALAAMFAYSWKLALFSLALVPAYAAIYFASDWLNRRYQREIMERSADLDAQIVVSLHSMSIVRSCGIEDEMSFRTETRLVRVLKRVWSAANAGLVIGGTGSFVTQAYSIGLLWIGADLVLDSQLTAGELMSCNALAGYITGPIVALIGMNAGIRSATTAMDRLYEVLDLEREKDEGTATLTLGARFSLEIDRLGFRYPGRLDTLKDVTLRFESGTISALVGKSGCGKSTLLAMIQRHYLPDSGNILIGGVDIQFVQLRALRSQIAYVPQKIDLLGGTVVENIAPNELQPDLPRIVELCRSVGILEFIESLPRGFQTIITENGANLSGGQKQRLAIVRALYTDAPIVLMDEPSSALDSESEAMLVETLRRMQTRGKLVILAVHNRSLLALCDQIVELQAGQVVKVTQQDVATEETAGAGRGERPRAAAPETGGRTVDRSAGVETQAMFARLFERSEGVLFGHTDANIMGVDENGRGWFLDDARCDVHAVTGKWPAVFGYDIPELTRGWAATCGFLPNRIRQAFDRGAVITVVWQPENFVTNGTRWAGCGVSEVLPGGSHHRALCAALDAIADNLGNLTAADGRRIPIVFRCWPQQNADHFWWGRTRCAAEEFVRLYRFTVSYLRDRRGVRNFLYAFSFSADASSWEEVQGRYPGDEYVDVVGVDRWGDDSTDGVRRFVLLIGETVRFCERHRKVPAVTALAFSRGSGQAGLAHCPDPQWLERGLIGPLLDHPVANRIAFLCFWRNEARKPGVYELPPAGSPHADSLARLARSGRLRFLEDEPPPRHAVASHAAVPALADTVVS